MRSAALHALVSAGVLVRGDAAAVAEWLGVSVRTVQQDLSGASGPVGPVRRPGRPRRDRSSWWCALRAVARVLRAHHHAIGWESVWRELAGRVTTYEAQVCTRACKAWHRRRVAAARERARLSVSVGARDVLWTLDGKHLSRDRSGELTAEVVKDVGSRRVLATRVGRPASGAEVCVLLNLAEQARGGPPLILGHDNGGNYRGEPVASWCRERGVLELVNVPHVPQHNACIERGMREIGEQTGLGRGVRDVGLLAAAEAVRVGCLRLNGKKRRVLGWRSAEEMDRSARPIYSAEARRELADEVCAATRSAVQDARGRRARRLAERRALLGVLAKRGLVTITRGGANPRGAKCARDT